MSDELPSIPTFLKRDKAAKNGIDTPLSNIPSTPQDPAKAPKPKPNKMKKFGTPPIVPRKAKAAKPKDKPKASKPAANPKATDDGPRGKSGIVFKMMRDPKGTTTADLLKATGWPAITAKGQGTAFAKKYGYKFSQHKAKGEPTRYFLKARD